MRNMMTSKSRRTQFMVRAAIVALCLGAAPMALATSPGDSAPDGAGYLLSHGSTYYRPDVFRHGEIMGYRERRDVPEPATWGMFGLGVAMIGVGVASRRRRSRAAGE